MTAPERYTEATVTLVAHAMCGDTDNDMAQAHTVAADILDALAEAGLLLPPGGTTRRVRWGAGSLIGPARERTATTWPDGSTYTGPWREVPDAD